MLAVTGCAANPGPPPVEQPTETVTETAEPTETPETEPPADEPNAINIGIDPLRNGLNPHLLSDDTAFVQSLASLVLPSAFRDGEIDTDVLVSAEEIEPADGAAQTLRYVISPEAQWSDGTPITGADFTYLWRQMTSTAGVIDAAAYESIQAIRTTDAGKTVDVDLARPLASWPGLFADLLPSHLAQDSFAEVLREGVPASAGRYMVQSVDRARGVVTVHRNDRFWGENPAQTDLLHFREIRSVSGATDQLRSGQVSFLDVTPQETSTDAFSLMADTQLRTLESPRELQLTLNTSSPALETADARAQLGSLLDVPLVARLAAGRSSDLAVAERGVFPETDISALQAATAEDPLQIAADPADDQASAAGRAVIDMLAGYGVGAEIAAVELADAAAQGLPDGEVDAVIAWRNSVGTPVDVASMYHCPATELAPRTGNLSGYCVDSTDAVLEGFLAGQGSTEDIGAFVTGLEQLENLTVPLLRETRVQVLGTGIVGLDPELENWPSGISSAASWRRS